MLYYEFKLTGKQEFSIPEDCHEKSEWKKELNENVEEVNRKLDYDVNFYIYLIKPEYIKVFGIIGYENKKDPKSLVLEFAKGLEFDIAKVDGEEISIHTLGLCAHKARKNEFLDDEDRILTSGCIGNYKDCTSRGYHEFIISDKFSKRVAKKRATCCGQSLLEEIERIYTKQKQKTFIGNPVHYILYTNTWEFAEYIASILTSALYYNKRLKTKRVALIRPERNIDNLSSFFDDNELNMAQTSTLLKIQRGGAIVIQPGNVSDENMIAREEDFHIEYLAYEIEKHKIETLSIIVFRKDEKSIASQLKINLPDLRFVEIEQESFNKDRAIEILLKKAKKDGIDATSSLISKIEDTEKAYDISDVNKIYNNWLMERLPTEVYSQYSKIEKPDISKLRTKGYAYSQLQSLIGLNSVKQVIQQALDFHKAQPLYKKAGIKNLNPARHMVFTGNPGTAKTTVARLFAQIMKDNQVLDRDDLIEVGRKDLVGKYVGWTARLVGEAFAKAQGSVLFIDEAYSLCEERIGLYGDEAINTIVQMMENQRSNTVVIFAGYPDKMEEFLDKNPGLRSRIAYHVKFDDYSTDELVQIFELMAKENNVCFAQGVIDKAKNLFEDARNTCDFGNGRYVRNLFEHARMKQACRLVSMDPSLVTDEVVRTLTVDDFSTVTQSTPKQINHIHGFAG